MEWHALLLLASGLAALGMWVGGRRSLRSVAPSGYWPIGWACILLTGLLLAFDSRYPVLGLLAYVSASSFAPLMLAGALQFVGRPVPRALFALPLIVGGTRIAADLLGFERLAIALPIFVEPAVLLVAAELLRREHQGTSLVSRAIAPGLLLLAILETADSVANLRYGTREVPWFAWVAVAIPLGAVQLISQIERLRELASESLAEVQSSEAHLRTVLSSLGSTQVVAFDRDSKILRIYGEDVPNGRIDYGVKRAEAEGNTPFTYLPADQAQRVSAAVREVFDGAGERQVDTDIELPTGTFHMSVDLAPVPGADGETQFVLGVVHDLTERVAARNELERSKNRLQAIVSALSQNRVVLLDREGRMESIVGLIEDRPTEYGIKQHDVVGAPITRFIPGAAGAEAEEKIARVFETGREERIFERVELPGGHFFFEAEMRALRGPGGEIEWVLAVCSDVTARVQAEERRRALESRVRQSQKLESLGVLAGGIAHDFNNLLSGILGNADLALSEAAAEGPVAAALADIRRSSIRAAELTTQLLAYAGRTSVAPAPVEIGALVAEMTALLRTSVGPGRLEIIPPEKPLWIHADATQIRQLVMNLITNAGEALPKAGDGSECGSVTSGSIGNDSRQGARWRSPSKATTSSSRSRTTAAAWTKRRSRTSSIRSSRRRSKAAAWALPPSSASFARTTACSRCAAPRVTARPSERSSSVSSAFPPPRRRPRSTRSSCRARDASWSSTTTKRCGGSPLGCCGSWGTRRRWPREVRKPSRSCGPPSRRSAARSST